MRFCIASSFILAVFSTSLIGAEKKPISDVDGIKQPSFHFQTPQRVRAGGDIVAVESPGFACPTMADVDGDGKQDLVVGQFRGGNMQFCKNIADVGQPPQFAKSTWLMQGSQRLEVPGVW